MGFLRIAGLASAGVLLLLAPLPVGAEVPEYQVKAAMLYKFAVFVEWPKKAFSTNTTPFVACVVGKDPFGPWLQQELGETRVGTHPVKIRRIKEGDAAGDCHLAFIAASEGSRLQNILPPLRKTGALIVSDVSDVRQFCSLGGMIALVMEGSKVRFQLNSKAIEQSGLKIDSRLKRVSVSADCGAAR